MKNTPHTDHTLSDSAEKPIKSPPMGAIPAPTSKKQRKTHKEETKKSAKETIEALHAAIAKETEACMENLILVSIVIFF